MRSLAAHVATWITALVTSTSAGCFAPPAQHGEVVIAAGASARLELAWRFGYVGVTGPEKPASATVITRLEDLPAGVGASARVGDVLLESGDVGIIVAAADGSPRAGALVAAWDASHPVDELGALRVVVYDRPVRATRVRPGIDAPTRAAWVDVLGVVDGPDGALEVATRYDVAPGVRGVLVHTSMKVPAGGAASELAVGDVVDAGSTPLREGKDVDGAPAALVVPRAGAGYALLALDAPEAIVDVARGRHGVAPSALPTPAGEVVIFSRFLAILPRPDALAVAVVQSRGVGRAVGELEVVAVDERGLPVGLAAGSEVVLRADGRPERLTLVVPRELRAGQVMVVEAPAGRFSVRLEGAAESDGARVEVEGHHVARVRLRAPRAP